MVPVLVDLAMVVRRALLIGVGLAALAIGIIWLRTTPPAPDPMTWEEIRSLAP